MSQAYYDAARNFFTQRQADMKANPERFLPEVVNPNPVGLNYPEAGIDIVGESTAAKGEPTPAEEPVPGLERLPRVLQNIPKFTKLKRV